MKYICSKCGKPTDNIRDSGDGLVYSWCDDCNNFWSRQYDFQGETETINERSLICPHCGHVYDDYDAYGFDDGESEEVVCEICGKKFDLEVECVRRYSTKRSLCEMPEDYGNEAANE